MWWSPASLGCACGPFTYDLNDSGASMVVDHVKDLILLRFKLVNHSRVCGSKVQLSALNTSSPSNAQQFRQKVWANKNTRRKTLNPLNLYFYFCNWNDNKTENRVKDQSLFTQIKFQTFFYWISTWDQRKMKILGRSWRAGESSAVHSGDAYLQRSQKQLLQLFTGCNRQHTQQPSDSITATAEIPKIL